MRKNFSGHGGCPVQITSRLYFGQQVSVTMASYLEVQSLWQYVDFVFSDQLFTLFQTLMKKKDDSNKGQT